MVVRGLEVYSCWNALEIGNGGVRTYITEVEKRCCIHTLAGWEKGIEQRGRSLVGPELDLVEHSFTAAHAFYPLLY